ncbi:MAG: hypothetical protein V3T17_02580 [Pseudomonadales bacterium]
MKQQQIGSGKVTAISMVVIIGLSVIGVITALSGGDVKKPVPLKTKEVVDSIALRNMSDNVVGVDKLVGKAKQYLQSQQPIQALYLLDVALAASPTNKPALQTKLTTLQYLLQQALGRAGNNYEKDYLQSRIVVTEEALEQ